MSTTAKWQIDWESFTACLQSLIDAGKSEGELAEEFADKSVKWRGTLRKKNLDDDVSPSVVVVVPRIDIKIDESVSSLEALSLAVCPDAVAEWKRASIGDEIAFSGRFLTKSGLMPPILVVHVGDGQAAVMIGLEDCEIAA